MIHFFYSIVFLLFLTPETFFQENGYFILFTKIDNQAKVYVNDSLVYESEVVDGNPDLNVKVTLDKYLKKGLNNLKIELYNGSAFNQVMTDTNWEIRYEIFNGKESVDYMHQTSANGKNGFAIDFQHDIYLK